MMLKVGGNVTIGYEFFINKSVFIWEVDDCFR